MELTSEQIGQLKELMMGLVPENPSTSTGNVSLSQQFLARAKADDVNLTLSDGDYWFIRDRLIEDGKLARGKGKGGSVRRVAVVTPSIVFVPATTGGEQKEPPAENVAQGEIALYEPFHQTVQSYYTKDNQIDYFVSQVTALQGRRLTGGKWTRPDVTLVAVRIYPFVPGKHLEVITFEIKPLSYFGVDGVFEAAAHSVFAHRSYLAVQIPADLSDSDDFDRLQRECKRFGIGLITFVDPANWESFEEVLEPEHRPPDPAEANAFISKQIAEEHKRRLQDLIR